MPPRTKIIIMAVAAVLVIILLWFSYGMWADQNLDAAMAAADPTPAQIELIVNSLNHGDPILAGAVAKKVLELGPKALDALVKRSQNAGKSKPRVYAAQIALQIDTKVGLEVLRTLSQDADIEIRQLVLDTLLYPEWRDKEGAGELAVQFAGDSDESIRMMLADNLGAFSPEVSEGALKQLLNDPNPMVKGHAQRELKNQALRSKRAKSRR